jgi:hypothetical protein
MGTLGGHLLPGTFFALFAIWWSFVTSIRYIQSQLKSPYKKNSLIGYRGSVTMPCLCLPCGKLKRAPIESWVKLIFAFIGILGEAITGFHIFTVNKPVEITNNTPEMQHDDHSGHEHGHNHKREFYTPQLIERVWYFEYVNAQHITMYTAFLLGSIVEILIHYRYDVPKRLDYVFGLIAFSIEGFLFANHLHSRDALDIHVHVLLVYAIYGCVLFTALEIYKPNQILFTYGRILFTMLQGTWFWEVGFILYPPTDLPQFQWNKNDHNQIMTVTSSYCWHILLIIAGLSIQLIIMKRLYKSSKRIQSTWDELILIDDMNQEYQNTQSNSIQQHHFLPLNSDDDDSNDEQVEFDGTALLRKENSEKIKMSTMIMNETSQKNKKKTSSNSSNTSSSSGHSSAIASCCSEPK